MLSDQNSEALGSVCFPNTPNGPITWRMFSEYKLICSESVRKPCINSSVYSRTIRRVRKVFEKHLEMIRKVFEEVTFRNKYAKNIRYILKEHWIYLEGKRKAFQWYNLSFQRQIRAVSKYYTTVVFVK